MGKKLDQRRKTKESKQSPQQVSVVKKDLVDELHKSARKNFTRRRVILKGINDLLQADLVEMIPYAKENKDFKYILIVINCFSKKVWAEPIKTKTGDDVTEAMRKIFTEMKGKPKNLQTDLGKEFYNKKFGELMKQYKINHYSVYSNKKACIVERVIRTIKNMIWKAFSLQGSYQWLDLLDEIVNRYNNTKHTSIGIAPSKVNKKNEKSILNRFYNHIKMSDMKTKFKVGDYVRISKYRSVFEKGYTPNWSNEIFKIWKVNLTNPTTYMLKDEKDENILGAFYELELQKVKQPGVYLVEKILRRRGNKVYVKWLGFGDDRNSWIDKKNVM